MGKKIKENFAKLAKCGPMRLECSFVYVNFYKMLTLFSPALQTTTDHQSSILHKSIFEALHPECTICNEKFESSEDFAKHLAVFYHVKVVYSFGHFHMSLTLESSF